MILEAIKRELGEYGVSSELAALLYEQGKIQYRRWLICRLASRQAKPKHACSIISSVFELPYDSVCRDIYKPLPSLGDIKRLPEYEFLMTCLTKLSGCIDLWDSLLPCAFWALKRTAAIVAVVYGLCDVVDVDVNLNISRSLAYKLRREYGPEYCNYYLSAYLNVKFDYGTEPNK